MQKGVSVQQLEPVFKIQANLDVEDSVFLTKILFEYVLEGKIAFELNSKNGSVINEFFINVVGGLFASVLYDVVKNIYNYLRKQKLGGKKVNPVYILLRDRQYVLTGEDSDEIPQKEG